MTTIRTPEEVAAINAKQDQVRRDFNAAKSNARQSAQDAYPDDWRAQDAEYDRLFTIAEDAFLEAIKS